MHDESPNGSYEDDAIQGGRRNGMPISKAVWRPLPSKVCGMLGAETPAKIQEITLLRPIHGNL